MPNKSNPFLIALVLALAVSIVALALYLPPPITPEQYEAAKKAAQESTCTYSPLRCFWDWTTHDAVSFYTLILAVFTAFLAVSTVGLLRATKRSAEIAERALTELEAPFVEVKIVYPGLETTTAIEGRLAFCFVNHGRTPARILEISDNIQVVVIGEMPTGADPRIHRGRAMPFGITAPPQGQCEEFGLPVLRSQMSGAPAGPHNFEQRLLYFIGYVQYADIFDRIFTVGFCLLYDPVRCRWAVRGDERYNYRRKEDGPYAPPPDQV